MSRRAQHFCEKNAEFPWTWCNLYCFKFRESSKCAAFFRNDKHSSESKRHPFTKISPVTYIYVCVYVIINIYTYMYMMYIYAYHIIPHIIIYMRLFHGLLKKHNIPLINNVVALYAILPLRVLDYNTSLKEYHWLHVGMFFQETSWQRSWGKRLYKIMAATLFVWK